MGPPCMQDRANRDTVCFRFPNSSLSAVSTGERMSRPALNSPSRSGRSGQDTPPAEEVVPAHPAPVARRRRFQLSSTSLLWAAIIVMAAALAFTFSHGLRTGQRKLTQDDINAAVLKTMETHVLPSEYAKAYENILPSVVRVMSYVKKSRLKEDPGARS